MQPIFTCRLSKWLVQKLDLIFFYQLTILIVFVQKYVQSRFSNVWIRNTCQMVKYSELALFIPSSGYKMNAYANE
jgi:hypothetical protein